MQCIYTQQIQREYGTSGVIVWVLVRMFIYFFPFWLHEASVVVWVSFATAVTSFYRWVLRTDVAALVVTFEARQESRVSGHNRQCRGGATVRQDRLTDWLTD